MAHRRSAEVPHVPVPTFVQLAHFVGILVLRLGDGFLDPPQGLGLCELMRNRNVDSRHMDSSVFRCSRSVPCATREIVAAGGRNVTATLDGAGRACLLDVEKQSGGYSAGEGRAGRSGQSGARSERTREAAA